MTSDDMAKAICATFRSTKEDHAACYIVAKEMIRQAILEEREACAKMCDAIESQWKRYGNGHANGAMDCAAAIRNREPV